MACKNDRKAASLMVHTLRGAVDCTGAGNGATCALDQLVEDHTMQVSYSGTGTLSALTVDLEGSLDGVNWFQLGQIAFSAGELTAKAAIESYTGKPVAYVRSKVVTITESVAGTILLKILWAGY